MSKSPSLTEPKERIEYDTPWPIVDCFEFPYKYFGYEYGGSDKTLLDIACGENRQRRILDPLFAEVTSADKVQDRTKGHRSIFKANIELLPKQWVEKPFDVVFSFETIEHIAGEKHVDIVTDLQIVSKGVVVIGSINRTGPSMLDDYEVWKDGKNPYHVAEYDHEAWEDFFRKHFVKPKFHCSIYTGRGRWQMSYGLWENGVCNYVVLPGLGK